MQNKPNPLKTQKFQNPDFLQSIISLLHFWTTKNMTCKEIEKYDPDSGGKKAVSRN